MSWNPEHYLKTLARRMKRLAAKRRHLAREERERQLKMSRRKKPSEGEP